MTYLKDARRGDKNATADDATNDDGAAVKETELCLEPDGLGGRALHHQPAAVRVAAAGVAPHHHGALPPPPDLAVPAQAAHHLPAHTSTSLAWRGRSVTKLSMLMCGVSCLLGLPSHLRSFCCSADSRLEKTQRGITCLIITYGAQLESVRPNQTSLPATSDVG